MVSSNIAIIALRGASMEAPPNTLPAIKKGIGQGAGATLLDIHSSRDGIPVAASDARLDKISNGRGRINKLSFEELQRLDAGSWFNSEYSGARFPSLEQVFDAVGTSHALYLHQNESVISREYADNLKRLSRDWTAAGGKLTFIVDDSAQVSAIRGFAVEAVNVLLMLSEKINGWILMQKAEKLGLKAIIPYRKQIDTVLVREAAKNNLAVIAFFANSEEDMKELMDMDVSGIVTCWPGKLKKVLENA